MASPAIASIKNLVTVVTGGASGLGKAVVDRIVREGGRVCVADLKSSKGEEVAKAHGAQAIFVPTDVTSEAELTQCYDKTLSRFGQINCLVTMAGIGEALKTYNFNKDTAHPLDKYEKVLRVNATGTFNAARLVCGYMNKNKEAADGRKGAIVMTASVAAFDGQQGQVAYSASKGAIVAMTLPMARDLARNGIRVNTVAPGVFDTPLLAGLPEKVKAHLGRQPPFPNRLGDPDELAFVIQHLLESPYINGEVIRVDGALRMPP